MDGLITAVSLNHCIEGVGDASKWQVISTGLSDSTTLSWRGAKSLGAVPATTVIITSPYLAYNISNQSTRGISLAGKQK